jgi:hypothetical protein
MVGQNHCFVSRPFELTVATFSPSAAQGVVLKKEL